MLRIRHQNAPAFKKFRHPTPSPLDRLKFKGYILHVPEALIHSHELSALVHDNLPATGVGLAEHVRGPDIDGSGAGGRIWGKVQGPHMH